jgi:cAMP-dependent protein kinase regulator
VTATVEDLARANRRLRQHPADYSAWLDVAALLGTLGNADDAELVFFTVGEGARVGGQVALAVACARHLAELGSVRGAELVDEVIETYATGGPHFKFTPPVSSPGIRLPAPPRVMDAPSGGPAPDDAPPQLAEVSDPLEEARVLVRGLGGWLASRPTDQVPPAPLLSALSKAGARALASVMTARAFPRGSVIIEAGAEATALYWIAAGSVTVAREGLELGELHSGAFFGEIALVGGTKRVASVIAREDTWVLEIPARAVETAAQKFPQLAEVLAFHARARLLANLTRTSELFRALGDDDRNALLSKFAVELVAAGTTFIHEGQPNEHLWVVVSGRCQVQSAGEVLAELGSGAAVGEISLVSGAKAVADVVAVEQVVLLRLAKADFDVVAKKHPKLLAEVEKLVVARETANRALFQDASDLIV